MIDLNKPLAGQTALVTGAAKRLGRSIALALAQAGADVAITYRASVDEAHETIAELQALGVNASIHHCHLERPEEVIAAVTATIDLHGRLDILVNNAGRFNAAPLESISVAEWDAMFAANTRGPFLMAQAAYPYLKEANGRIINIGSLGGMAPWATHGHYCASKAALHMLSQTMAKAWAPEISVNCVAPGMIVQGEIGEAYQHFADKTPMKRNGTAADVAAACLFFATGPHFVTGQVLAVDGGLGL